MLNPFTTYGSTLDTAATKEQWMSSNNSLYHSSPCLKKVLSEQFLHQFKQKTDIDQIRLKLKELQVRRGKGAQDDQDGSGFLTGATPNKTQNIDCKIKATTAAKGQQSKLGAAGNAKGAQGVQLQSSLWKTGSSGAKNKQVKGSTQMQLVNDPSGLNGLSFCPMHRNCPQEYARR